MIASSVNEMADILDFTANCGTGYAFYSTDNLCWNCYAICEPEWKYCPYCGELISAIRVTSNQ
jgi:rRNA maturation endonuclease Nob1